MIKKLLAPKILQYFFLMICVGIILRYFQAHREELSLLSGLTISDLLGILSIGFLIHFLTGYKMFLILNQRGLQGVPFGEWFEIFSISRFVNLHITQGGNVYRGIELKRKYRFSYTQSIEFIVACVWIESVCILLIAMIMLGIFSRSLSVRGMNILGILSILSCVFIFFPLGGRALLHTFRPRNKNFSYLYDKAVHLVDSIVLTKRDLPLWAIIFFLNLIMFPLFFLQIYLSFHAIHIGITPSEALLFTIITLLCNLFNITPSNIGVTELAYGGLSNTLGKTLGNGVLVSGLLRILWYILFAVLAFAVWTLSALRNKRSRT